MSEEPQKNTPKISDCCYWPVELPYYIGGAPCWRCTNPNCEKSLCHPISDEGQSKKMNVKYEFVSYWKYEFTLKLKNGKTIRNEEQNPDEVYKLGILHEGEAMQIGDGKYVIDGTIFSYFSP